jgi:ribonuclease D
MFKDSITVEELTELPLKNYEGEIVLVTNERMAEVAAAFLRQFDVIGFDTETKPSFRKGDVRKVALLQLAAGNRAFLFRTQKVGIPSPILSILSDPDIKKAGVAIRDDLVALQKISRFKPAGFVELQDHARNAGILNFSLKKLCAILCGFRVSKSQQLSNWESDVLTDQQMNYAATDAWVSLLIYERLFNTGN